EPEKFEDHYEEALTELITAKRQGKDIGPRPRPRGENVVDLMDALKKSIASEAAAPKGKKARKASAGQKEMLLPIEGKGRTQKKNAKPERAHGLRKAGVRPWSKSRWKSPLLTSLATRPNRLADVSARLR